MDSVKKNKKLQDDAVTELTEFEISQYQVKSAYSFVLVLCAYFFSCGGDSFSFIVHFLLLQSFAFYHELDHLHVTTTYFICADLPVDSRGVCVAADRQCR